MNLQDTLELTKAAAEEYQTFVLVEGTSDMLALSTLAGRLALDLEARRVAIVAMGGVTNIKHFLDLLTSYQQTVNIVGLYDMGEEPHICRVLEDAGFGTDLTRSDLETLGFYVCDADLEDELIRSVGVDKIIDIATQEGEIGAFRTFQRQPEWRGRDAKAQLRRWLGAGATRKIRYAELMAKALDIQYVPTPLDALISHISRID